MHVWGHTELLSGREEGVNSTHFGSAHVECDDPEEIQCEGKAYKTRVKLDCEFHALLYEIECMERAKLASQLAQK